MEDIAECGNVGMQPGNVKKSEEEELYGKVIVTKNKKGEIVVGHLPYTKPTLVQFLALRVIPE